MAPESFRARLVEVRSYRLRAGTGAAFHERVQHCSVPLQRAAGIDVVWCGRSVESADQYVLIRAFDDIDDLRHLQTSFYASRAWREGPRESIVGLIESDHVVVLPLTVHAIEALRKGFIAD